MAIKSLTAKERRIISKTNKRLDRGWKWDDIARDVDNNPSSDKPFLSGAHLRNWLKYRTVEDPDTGRFIPKDRVKVTERSA